MSEKYIPKIDEQIILELTGAMLGWRAKLKHEREDIEKDIDQFEYFLEQLSPGILPKDKKKKEKGIEIRGGIFKERLED